MVYVSSEDLNRVYQAINSVSKRLEEINSKLDNLSRNLHNQSTANIDYLAMMTNNELPNEEVQYR